MAVRRVSEADYAADTFLRETLMAARPDYGWLSEETVDTPARHRAQRLFVVDPIDGTRGFLDGGNEWCVSVAVVEAGRPVVGVLQAPARKERFWAVSGEGAFLDGARLRVAEPGQPPQLAGPKPMVDRFGKIWPGGGVEGCLHSFARLSHRYDFGGTAGCDIRQTQCARLGFGRGRSDPGAGRRPYRRCSA
jgi:hypothetical protein